MPESVVTVTPSRSQTDGLYHSFGTLAVGSGDYTSGGILLNLAKAEIKAQRVPIQVKIEGRAGYHYSYVPGTSISNGKLKINTTAATELAAAAMPAGVTGDTIQYEAVFAGMQ